MADYKKGHITTPSLSDALDEEFLTEKQLAERWRLSPKTFRNLRSRGGGVPYFKSGGGKRGNVRYQLSVVLAYELAHRMPQASHAECETRMIDLRAEKFITEKQLATRHQRSEKTLRNDRANKIGVPYYKLGGAVRYALSDVRAYERAYTVTSTTAAQARDDERRAPPRHDVPHDRSRSL